MPAVAAVCDLGGQNRSHRLEEQDDEVKSGEPAGESADTEAEAPKTDPETSKE